MEQPPQQLIKQNLGKRAADLVQEGMLVGLGTGTTATYFINSLSQRCQDGLQISAVASSEHSLQLARKGGIPTYESDRVTEIDLTVDGADEIDPHNRMIKGGGGALSREKILASASKKLMILVDESKLVSCLGKFGVPVEILPFCHLTTLAKIRKLGYEGTMRTMQSGKPYHTDNGNLIVDIHTPAAFPQPEQDHRQLSLIPGVVETGLFVGFPLQLLVGYRDGSLAFREI